jgi:hypothetical protein
MRLADDDTCRPSTHDLSETGIRVSHSLQTIIRFTPVGLGETKEMKISHPCKISSCDCMDANLQLPGYSKEDPNQAEYRKIGHESKCLCWVAAKEGKEEMLRLYGSDPETLGAASHFGSAARGRERFFKTEEQYAQDLEDGLRSRSVSRGRSPYATPTPSRPPSPSRSGSRGGRNASRPPSRSQSPFPGSGYMRM